ncbi:MAG: hypothetical protein J6C34_09750 [Oscillospiraceae bacterium]|nr:hypothetical protein [Oscillospiraceae bacterium]
MNWLFVLPCKTDWYSRYDIQTAFVSPEGEYVFSIGFSSEEELSELSEEDIAEELSEEFTLEDDEDDDNDELEPSVFEEEADELFSASLSEEVSELSLPEDSETDELSLLLWIISGISELLSEEGFPRIASSSIISGSSLTTQPVIEIIISKESKTEIIFFISFPPFFNIIKNIN